MAGERSLVVRVRLFNVELFERRRRRRMVWAAAFSGVFVLVMVVACSASGVW